MLFGFDDPLRGSVVGGVQCARRGGILTRMVSGDGLACCKAVAIKANIIENPGAPDQVMTGEQFRERFGKP